MSLHVKFAPGMGRGVFTDAFIPTGTLVEVAPVLMLPIEALNVDPIQRYAFHWGEHECALGLGYASLYNHSDTPNLEARPEWGSNEIWFWSLTDIQPGAELTHYYGNNEFA